MKILIIHGSMRKGNTYAVTRKLIDRLLSKPDVECTEISVADLDLPFCSSCHACLTRGEEYCPHFPITGGVQSALMDCDGVIVSGVSYIRSLNAAMKNLLDHFAYGYHRPAFFGKKGMVVTTSAGTGEKGVAKYLKTVLGQWGINGAIVVTRNEKEKRLQTPEKETEILNRYADRFYQLTASKQPVLPSLQNIVIHNAFRAMSLSEFGESERDTQYWLQDGYRDKAYPVEAGPFRYAVGAIMYKIIGFSAKMIGKVYAKRLDSQ